MKHFLIALQFLTVFPVKLKEAGEKDFGKSLRYFPLVGTIIGLILAVSLFLFSRIFPDIISRLLILVILVVITGAIHLDGFADTCDGLYGSRERRKVLEIMRDSHIGAIGAVGLILLLLLKFGLLYSIPYFLLGRSLIVMATLGRWFQVLACCLCGYAEGGGKGKYFVKYAKKREFIFSSLFSLAVVTVVMNIKGIALFILSTMVILPIVSYIKRRIGGMTGDTIGAIAEASEVIILFISLTLGILANA